MRAPNSLLAVLIAGGLCACAGPKKLPGDDQPTLKSLQGRSVAVDVDRKVSADEKKAMAAYQDFLKAAPKSAYRPDAMRRLGDLEMDSADNRLANGETGPNGAADYRAAIARYQDYLKTYPNDPGNDRVYYQMARAYEQGGDLETALKTLDTLVARYPKTRHYEEAQFRRGELLFTMRDYPKAEQAYATLLGGQVHTQYHERALYMHGWSLFKQGRLEEALNSFFGVLDAKLGSRGPSAQGGMGLDSIPNLTRADRELVEDTFRVSSLSFATLQGADSIPAYVTTTERRDYAFRVYEQLGELYTKQERFKDAADTFGAFARRDPTHAQAPVMQARVIDIYQHNGFATLALDAKKDYVEHYGAKSDFRRTNEAAWQNAQPLVKTHLAELAQHYHASAQKNKKTEDYQEAVRWYRAYLEAFPNDPDTARTNFLLAELLYEDGQFNPQRYAEAAAEYEKTAYRYPRHAKSADAGYAALLAYAQQEKRAAPADLKRVQLASVDSALHFSKTFADDPRVAPVLTNAAEKLYASGDAERAVNVAEQVLALKPPANDAQRRVAWTVIAHTSFDRGAFDRAERAYGEVLALAPANDPARKDLSERAAAAVYKQGEQARAAGRLADAVRHFERVATVAPNSAVRATAEYDAAAALMTLKDWDGATRMLTEFRRRYPNHALQDDVSSKLAVAYMEQGQWGQAASEFERIAATRKDPQLARAALWQAAELHEKVGARSAAATAYERYVKQYPEPFETALEARYRLAGIARTNGNTTQSLAWMKQVVQADQTAGRARTDRTRYVAGMATLALAEPTFDAYRKVALVEPLAKQLKLKKAKMEEVLKAYGAASNYGVAEVTTAATYRTAELYRDFGQALMDSQRPKRLSKIELEQYNVMLEEQAYPFEEKAIELHEINARRTTNGIYDQWVKDSFTALAKLRPVRYGKTERTEGAIDAIR